MSNKTYHDSISSSVILRLEHTTNATGEEIITRIEVPCDANITNDVERPSPKGSRSADDTLQKPGINLRKESNIGTWNVRSLNVVGKLKVLEDEMNRL